MENPASSQLSYDNHPFFQDLQPLSLGLKSLYDQVLASEGDLFEKCSISWSQFRLFFLEAFYAATAKLEVHTILTLTTKIIFEVAEVMAM